MPTRSAGPAEPTVLAHATRALFPAEAGYVVADTQFATDRWRADRTVDPSVRDALAPFNRVRVGGGYPDLVGVGHVPEPFLAGEAPAEPPLIAVEAKGYTAAGTVDVERGIVQAHDRVAAANAAYLVAPADAVGETARTLASDLNVGLVGVESEGGAVAMSTPRLVGTGGGSIARGIRFQASTAAVTDDSFGLNHPRNYLGYAVAVYADADAERATAEHVVGAVDDARAGAVALGLVEGGPGEPRLTPLGAEVVRFAIEAEGSAADALAFLETLHGRRSRFTDLAPAWARLARRVLFTHPAVSLLVEEGQRLADEGTTEPTLRELCLHCHRADPTFAVELFLRRDRAARERAFVGADDLDREALADGSLYHAPTTFQLKAMCYHAGIYTTGGTEPHRLDPTTERWALESPL